MSRQHEQEIELRRVWNALMWFAHSDNYTLGERTSGILEGCKRGDPPSPEMMAGYAKMALASLRRYLGIEPDDWMLDGGDLPAVDLQSLWMRIDEQQFHPSASHIHPEYRDGYNKACVDSVQLVKNLIIHQKGS